MEFACSAFGGSSNRLQLGRSLSAAPIGIWEKMLRQLLSAAQKSHQPPACPTKAALLASGPDYT